MDLNVAVLSGRLTKDPTASQSGKLVMFPIACNTMFGGEKKTTFLNCKAFGRVGELVLQYCTKGMMVQITGSIDISSYENSNGEKATSLSIIVNGINFVRGTGKSTESEQSSSHSESSMDDDIPF